MAEEAPAAESTQGQDPPDDVIIKLALQFLSWKDVECYPTQILHTSVGLVCKRWNELLDTNEVGRPLSLNLLKWYEKFAAIRRARAEVDGRLDEYGAESYFDARHRILDQILLTTGIDPQRGRSYKDMFVLSEKMGTLIMDHKYDGPDAAQTYLGDTRTLRETLVHDYRWIVRPTIERLRGVFDLQDDNTTEQTIATVEMKKSLLHHARCDHRKVLRRKSLATLEKDDLAKYVGQSLFALAKSNNLDTQMFVAPSSLPDVSLGDTIGGIESIIGKEIAAQLSIEVKKTCSGVKRKITCLPIKKTILRETSADDELDWPINPVDCISFFIRQLWPFEFDLDYDMDATEEEKEQLWVDTITKFWFDLAEPIRQLLVTVFNAEVATKFVDVEPIPVDTPTRDAPIKLLKTMICLPYSDFRAKVSERIWHDLDPSLREEIFEIYRQQAEIMCEAIQDEYHGVYSEKLSLAQNADVLLDIFLEVPPRRDDDPRYTGSFSTESCDSFVVRMEETMNRWNELITEVKTNEDILWDPQALTELNSFEPMFAHSCRRRKVAPTLEFCVHNMIHEFLYRALSCTQKLPSSFCFKDEVEKFWDDYVKPGNFQGLPDSHTVECDARCKRLLRDFRALSTYIHTTRHAFIALMPLLPHLSKMGSKRLVYALFIQRKCNRGTKWSWPRCEFSDKHFGAHKFYPLAKIPCAYHDDSDFGRILEWHRHRYSYLGSSEEDILGHILGLPLPENIVSSMGEFMVENLYQENIDDVDETKIYNATGVMRYLERFCYENLKVHILFGSAFGKLFKMRL